MESDDYETNRNLTLMFFLEKLLDKGAAPRSLHDLSCQFGTKGFSKSMRQIAGGSQSGLRKFFQQYPSLFTIDGEMVTITQTGNGKRGSEDGDAGGRDYSREAVEYFKKRLEQYGIGTEVPIKSLLGHRSQAPPEVRHVSGQHIKEFRDFLAKYPDDFVTNDEVIYLKEYEGKITQRYCESSSGSGADNVAPIDPQLTGKLLSLMRAYLEASPEEGVAIETLFEETVLQDSQFESLPFKKSQDLTTFLRMHSHLFKVNAGIVTLVPIRTMTTITSPTPPSGMNSNTVPLPTGSPKRENGTTSMTSSASATNLSLKQRVNSVVMKALAINSEMGRVNPRAAPTGSFPANGIPKEFEDEESLKTSILQRTRVVLSSRESSAIFDEIWNRKEAIAVDCEGVSLGTKGQLTTIQIGTMSGMSYIFDLLSDSSVLAEGKLKKILESEEVVKVFHDCRNDAGILHGQYGITLNHIFDTQSAHAVLELQDQGKPVYKAKSVSYSSLCDMYGASPNPLKDQIKAVYRRDQRFWARRPLTADMVVYAAADVLALVPNIYLAMKSAIKPEFSNLLKDLCDEQVMFNIDPEGVKSKKKQRKLDFEVSDLRMKLAASAGKNIVLSNREIRLLRHVELTEEDKERLRGSYKVAKKLEKLENKDKGNDSDDNSDGGNGNGDNELPSLESVFSDGSDNSIKRVLSSPDNFCLDSLSSENPSQPASLTDSMAMVNKILVDEKMDRLERIEKLESILTSVTQSQGLDLHLPHLMTSSQDSNLFSPVKVDASTQTISTGDINIIKVYSPTKEVKE